MTHLLKILIVEDDPTIASAIKSHLESWGYAAKTTSDFKDVIYKFISQE